MNNIPEFGIYIHWPFCQSKCPYCDFNSHVRSNGIDEQNFLKAYIAEINYMAQLTPERTVRSIFFGGGTPSLMSSDLVFTLIEHISQNWKIDPDVEITLEANPSSVEAERFAQYKQAGVNRVSLGIQALNDKDLKHLGRLHTVSEAEKALETAKNQFARVSFDLIYARPDQSPQSWEIELQKALEWNVKHLSLYQLTIEPGTRFADLYRIGKLQIPESQQAEEHYHITQNICSEAGLKAYEISNHCKPGEECIHNLLYWNYGEYAGIGPGAHSRLRLDKKSHAISCERNPEQWSTKVKENGNGVITNEPLSKQQQADELILMGLRLRDGFSINRLEKLTSYTIDLQQLKPLLDEGLLKFDPQKNSIMAHDQGRFILNYLIEKLSMALIEKTA